MSRTPSDAHMATILAWQRSHPGVLLPPFASHRRLHAWVRYCRRAQRRGCLSPSTLAALRSAGLDLDSADRSMRNAAKRGIAAAIDSAQRQLRAGRGAPSLSSPDLRERHAASWMVRLQAGIVTESTMCSALRGSVHDVMASVAQAQSAHQGLAAWLNWCARAAAGVDQFDPRRHWHQAVYEPARGPSVRDSPFSEAAAELLAGHAVTRCVVPEPRTLMIELLARLPASTGIAEVRVVTPPPWRSALSDVLADLPHPTKLSAPAEGQSAQARLFC